MGRICRKRSLSIKNKDKDEHLELHLHNKTANTNGKNLPRVSKCKDNKITAVKRQTSLVSLLSCDKQTPANLNYVGIVLMLTVAFPFFRVAAASVLTCDLPHDFAG